MNKIERNRQNMYRFMECINTNDKILAEELIAPDAKFTTPVSDKPLYGGAGYLSVVDLMRKSFSDIRWDIADMAVEEGKVAVSWICSGTHNGEFMGLPPTYKKISFSVMNFYYFNADGKIISDVAAQGMFGLLATLGLVK
ncbi:MAG: ester cyclase [Selenomonadaceae bacterium]|nr:ester cyclase [Selenomonadaceae bacterium]MBQ3725718.1 ester cyclase [Selenomonadaceae bacterium]